MIDRKAFRISGIILLAMIAANVWRLSLLPDWHHMPVGGPGSHNSVSGLILFAAPASLLITIVMPFIPMWLMSPKETLPSWRRWGGKWIVSWSVFMALAQAFGLAHSLGLVSLSALGSGRVGLVIIGIIFMMLGNAAPKAPLQSQRNSPLELDSWQQNRLLRFVGKLLFGVGLAFTVGAILLPLEYWEPIFLGLMIAALAAGIWYSVQLRREPRGKVLEDAQ